MQVRALLIKLSADYGLIGKAPIVKMMRKVVGSNPTGCES